MATLALTLTTPEKVDARTVWARRLHHVMGLWLGCTQAWTWEGGDALVVTCGREYGRVQSWAAVRQGDEVKCVEISSGGIAGYLRAFGYETAVAS